MIPQPDGWFSRDLLSLMCWELAILILIYSREGSGNPLQCSCLENPRDGGAWWAAAYGVAQGRTRLKRLRSSSSSIFPLQVQCFFKHLLCARYNTGLQK